MNQELLEKAMRLKQASEESEQQLNFVVQQIGELEEFSKSLEEIEKSKETGIMAPLGKGVFMKASREDDKLFVEVGADVIVKKTPAQAREIIEGQIKKFQEARIQLSQQLEQFAAEFREMLAEVEKLKSNKK